MDLDVVHFRKITHGMADPREHREGLTKESEIGSHFGTFCDGVSIAELIARVPFTLLQSLRRPKHVVYIGRDLANHGVVIGISPDSDAAGKRNDAARG
jgi:hypothetical protein